jgi:hypothetical protein
MQSSRAAALRCRLGIIFLLFSGIAHSADDAFVTWAAANALPMATLESSEDFSDLQCLKPVVGTARIVALGEPTHGAHEPLAFRNRLIRFLVEQMGFTAIALESGFTESSISMGLSPAVRAKCRACYAAACRAEAVATARTASSFSGCGTTTPRLQRLVITESASTVSISRPGAACISGTRLAIDYALAYLSRANPADEDVFACRWATASHPTIGVPALMASF